MVNSILRLLLGLWVVGYLLVSCVPMLTGNGAAGAGALLVGGVLLVPWLVGVLVLAILAWLTTPRRR